MSEAWIQWQDAIVLLPSKCTACGKPLLMVNPFVDDGCPCNSPRGVNVSPRPCELCKTDHCVKPAHVLLAIARSAALEEAAKECEKIQALYTHAVADEVAERCARRIRALKTR